MAEEAVQAEAVAEAMAEGTPMATSPGRDPILDPLPSWRLSVLRTTQAKVPLQPMQP